MPTETKVEVSIAGDYAVMKTGDLYFYYGYEFVWCDECKAFGNHIGHHEDHNTEWAFKVRRGDYNGTLVFSERCDKAEDEFEVSEQLLYGIAKYLAAKGKS